MVVDDCGGNLTSCRRMVESYEPDKTRWGDVGWNKAERT